MLRILAPSRREFSYNDSDLLFVMEKLAEALSAGHMVGRGRISSLTGIGEGMIRSILQKLKSLGFLSVTRTGITLSITGSDLIRTLGVSLADIGHTDSAIGIHQVALIVKGKADMINKGVEQRDSGLKSGGDGCTTIVCREGVLMLPPDWNVDERSPQLASDIRRHGITDGDVLLIGGSNTGIREAARAVNSAMLELIE